MKNSMKRNVYLVCVHGERGVIMVEIDISENAEKYKKLLYGTLDAITKTDIDRKNLQNEELAELLNNVMLPLLRAFCLAAAFVNQKDDQKKISAIVEENKNKERNVLFNDAYELFRLQLAFKKNPKKIPE